MSLGSSVIYVKKVLPLGAAADGERLKRWDGPALAESPAESRDIRLSWQAADAGLLHNEHDGRIGPHQQGA